MATPQVEINRLPPTYLRETRLWLNEEETERLMRFLAEEMWPEKKKETS